ncbi:MAG: gamma-glutamyltransferase [Gammaproteobacteria bacterium]|nr:gamma-glutamyltransferase [Gammaproteobacteria bacterium]
MTRRLIVLAALSCGAAWAASPEALHAQHGMVVSRSMLASQAGADILARGGNAIDAAVATGFALAVTYPSAGNLGGGGFMVISLADGTVIANDHREVAPSAAHRDMYLDDDGNVDKALSRSSTLAVGVPGTVDGLLGVLEKYGTMKRRDVIEPARRLAQDGFALNWDIVVQLQRLKGALAKHPATAAIFTKDGGDFAPGERLRQPDLAQTLGRIIKDGRAGFYAGETADLIVAQMQRGGGIITHEDLHSYTSVWREPARGNYRGHEIVSMPPPSSGGVLLIEMLNMLEPFDVGGLGYGSAAAVHLMIEAERRAYADRAEHLGDPDFYPVPVDMLVDKRYARQRFADFKMGAATKSDTVSAGAWPVESTETTHVSVVDKAGNAVAYTTTLNGMYGVKMVVGGAGFLLNNEMDDFSAKENAPNMYNLVGREANSIAPRKRMLSSMAPTIVLKDGKPLLVTGSPGGSTIITTVLQVIVNVVDHGMDLTDAVGSPRFHHQWRPDRVFVEPQGFSPDTTALLQAMGHENIRSRASMYGFRRGIGEANSIMVLDDGILGVADPRVAGGAAGY